METTKKVEPRPYILYAVVAFFVIGGIYTTFFGGNPKVVKFRNDCYQQQTRNYLPGYVPDFVIENATAYCEHQLREHLHAGSGPFSAKLGN
jgi:hypothetical protein